MQVRLLLGPAGSGKTFRCLAEIRQALVESAEGPPLVLVAPKQMTYQLERQLLAEPTLTGYTRLHILSFERLAHFIFDQLQQPEPEMLDEEGRVMVLRGLLAEKRHALKLFRASARLTGFAQQLSLTLGELQRHQLTPESLIKLAGEVHQSKALAYKLQDLATLLQDYLDWLKAHRLVDAEFLIQAATEALMSVECRVSSAGEVGNLVPRPSPFAPRRLAGLWVDGFVDWAPQESELLAALAPHCDRATFTFCLDRVPREQISWLSNWSVVRHSFEECKKALTGLPGIKISEELLERDPRRSRFSNNAVLQHLEKFWGEPRAYEGSIEERLRIVTCANPEAETVLAAREILQHVRKGGRFREIMVLARKLDLYHQTLQRVFSRYEIPFFLDRRESVAHHPLAELTRSALRTVSRQWLREDWFAALKTGLIPAEDVEIDRLENEALARGWKGADWQQPMNISGDAELSRWLADLHSRIVPPFQRLALALESQHKTPTGPQLAKAIREFWDDLKVEQRLTDWTLAPTDESLPSSPLAPSVHATVWEQMNNWLENIELAFPHEPLSLRHWMPILDAGLAGLTVGVIPPALDQVLVGAIERSRTPEVKLAIVLGMNETVFPAAPQSSALLTETDRAELETREIVLSANPRQQISRERFYAYLAFTRARERLVLTASMQDVNGKPLNLSSLISPLRRLFPQLPIETADSTVNWKEAEHASELIPMLLKGQGAGARVQSPTPINRELASKVQSREAESNEVSRAIPLVTRHSTLVTLPAVASLLEQLRDFQSPREDERLAPELAERLYGPVLRTSVSRIEQFAACPFRFLVHSGLRAEERKEFELDIKEQGSFQHDVLALFHQQLTKEERRWRDITPQQARERIAAIANALRITYRDGLLQASEESRFTARVLTESLQNFAETLVSWMREQYQFDPVAVELPFGEDGHSPAWQIDLGNGHKLALQGRMDRVDLWRGPENQEAKCVVIDYKSSQKQLEPLLMAHGLQLQLLAYLNVLRQWPNAAELFGCERLSPAGVFYVNLRGKYERRSNRVEALGTPQQMRKGAYRHTGRFDASALPQLDARTDAVTGDQFNYRLTNAGHINKTSREAMDRHEFEALLGSVQTNLKRMGMEIYAGNVTVSPYRKGKITACDQCSYRSICRIDPWTHAFRVLR